MYRGYTTADVFPPELEIVKNSLRKHLTDLRLTNKYINICLNKFHQGYNF